MLAACRYERVRMGFTLVELLVVITIIGILASLVLVGASAARTYVRQGVILTEIDTVSGKFQEYQQKYGSYPPNTIVNNASDRATILADVKRHFKQAFPKHQEHDSLFAALVDVRGDSIPGVTQNTGMNAAEAVVFWLGGFSSDPRYPVSGKGGPSVDSSGIEDLEGRNFLMEFEVSRLGPRNASGAFDERVGRITPPYQGPGGRRRIRLWTYTPRNSGQPLVYFDTSRHKPHEYDPVSYNEATNSVVVALKTLPASGAVTDATPVQFENAKSFQVLHSGLDNAWGDYTRLAWRKDGKFLLYPSGPFTEDFADNLVNFSRGTLEDSEP
jgi:prepilin-type N-terminal cleavage/methylation domain-containing protein